MTPPVALNMPLLQAGKARIMRPAPARPRLSGRQCLDMLPRALLRVYLDGADPAPRGGLLVRRRDTSRNPAYVEHGLYTVQSDLRATVTSPYPAPPSARRGRRGEHLSLYPRKRGNESWAVAGFQRNHRP